MSIISSAEEEYQKNCTISNPKLLERKYNEDNLNKQMEKVDLTEQKELL